MLVLVSLDVVLTLTKDRSTVCVERTVGSEIVMDAPDGLLGDIGDVESCFNPFEDSGTVSARWVHCLCQTYHRHINSFGHTRWYS
jgi:hypothetical protein